MDGKGSKGSSLDSHLGHKPSYVGLEELEQARLGLPLLHHSVGDVRRFLDVADLSREKAESGTWRVWGLRLVKSFKILLGI